MRALALRSPTTWSAVPLLAWLVTSYAPLAPQPTPGVEVTVIASEGVMLASGDTKVLIDALFLPYGAGYAVPDDATQRALQAARAPFDGVDVVLATHRHGDHFHPTPVIAHLRANPGAAFVASGQTIDSVRAMREGQRIAPSQLLARSTLAGLTRTEVVNGVRIHALGIRHTGGFRHRHVDHLGFLVEIGARRVLHLGDGEITEETMRPLRLDTMRVDVALVPSWVVGSREGAEVLRRWVKAAQIVPIHLPERPDPAIARRIRQFHPQAKIPERKGAAYRF